MVINKFAGRLILFGAPLLLVILFIVGIVALIKSAPQTEQTEPEARPVAVFVVEAVPTPVTLSVRSHGEVRPKTELQLTAQVSGRIQRISPNFTEGGFFERGEVLVELEDADYRLAVTRAEAQVAQANQRLIREEAEAELARDEWRSMGRGEPSALAMREPQLAEARANLAAAQASLEEARLAHSRTRIRAPFRGRVREKLVDAGQFVGPGAQLGAVFSTDRAQIRLPLSDAELARLDLPIAYQESAAAPGPAVTLETVVAGEPRRWQGRVVRTDSAIDARTRSLFVIIEVEDPYGSAAEHAGAPLANGLFVEAEIAGRSVERAFVLPRSALRGADQLLIVDEQGLLSVRTATVIDSSAAQVIVTSGVKAGEWVVTSPVRAAADGMAVTPLDENGEALPIERPALAESAESEESEESADRED